MNDMSAKFIFDSREEASAAAAQRMAELCREQLAQFDCASLVVSGGTTPGRCFELLSTELLDWSNVTVLLSDERWVPPDHADSNEKLLRDTLLTGAARDAKLISVYQEDLTVDEGCDALQSQSPAEVFACSLLGMGTDGHFASLFPGSDDTAAGLNPENTRLYIPVSTAASPHPRVSMTLAALSGSEEIILLIFGEEKRAVYERAVAGDTALPIFHLLQLLTPRVCLYWAP
jgi:6-phosphogluconolactonase